MRSFIFVFYYLFVLIISLPLYLVAFILRKANPLVMHRFAQGFVSIVFKCALALAGTSYRVIGLSNVPKDQAVLYVANHRGFADVAITYGLLPGPTSYIAKKEIKKAIGIAQWMYFLNCFFLDRDDIREGLNMVLFSIERIKSGYSIFIAPEGTRNPTDTMLPFKEGSFKIAQKTGCLIVPVVLNNTEDVLEAHLPWIKKAKVCVEFGTPIDRKDLSPEHQKAIGPYIRNIMQDIYDKNQARLNL